MKNDGHGDKQNGNVIDMTERIPSRDTWEERISKLKGVKVRFDLEQAKVAVSTSLLSIVLLVTVANSNLMTSLKVEEVPLVTRGIASVPTGTSDAEDTLVRELARRDLSQSASIGRQPTLLQSLAFGRLEGKYAIRLLDGKIAELEFNKSAEGSVEPTQLKDLSSFLSDNRELFPVAFDRTIRIDREESGDRVTETYQLVDKVSRPLAKVRFELNSQGGLITMSVSSLRVAAN